MDEKRGNIHLNGKDYRIDLASYKARDVTDFSPRSSTPGGGIVFGEMGLYQVLVMTDWSRGFGFQWMTEAGAASGYLRTTGNLDTRHMGLVTLMTQATASDSAAEQKNGFTLFDDHLFAWTDKGGRVSDTALADTATPTWTEAEPLATSAAIHTGWSNGKYLFAFVDDEQPYYTTNPTSAATDWTGAGATTAQIDTYWIQHHDGFVYSGRQLNASGLLGNQVHYSDAVDLSDLYTVASDDPNVLYAGIDGMQILGAFSFLGDIDFRRPDGLWKMDRDKSAIRKVLDYGDQTSSENFASGAIYNNAYVYPIRNTLYSWNGMRVTNITPPRLTEQFPYTTYGRFRNFVTVGSYLFMTARTNETTYTESIVVWDGVGWHRLMDPITDGDGSVTAMYFDTSRNYLWYHVTKAASNLTSYIPFQDNSEFAYANFPTSGQNRLFTPRIDAGFRRVKKSTPSIIIEGSNLAVGNTYLSVFYALDGESTWHAWGGVDGTTNVVVTDGVTELKNPLGYEPSTLEYNYMQLRIHFYTATATETPVLEAIAVRLLLRPQTLWGFAATIVAAQDVQYGPYSDNRTPDQIVTDLKDARDSASPVKYVDPYGHEHQVYVTAVSLSAVEEHASSRGSPNIEARINVNLAEVG